MKRKDLRKVGCSWNKREGVAEMCDSEETGWRWKGQPLPRFFLLVLLGRNFFVFVEIPCSPSLSSFDILFRRDELCSYSSEGTWTTSVRLGSSLSKHFLTVRTACLCARPCKDTPSTDRICMLSSMSAHWAAEPPSWTRKKATDSRYKSMLRCGQSFCRTQSFMTQPEDWQVIVRFEVVKNCLQFKFCTGLQAPGIEHCLWVGVTNHWVFAAHRLL